MTQKHLQTGGRPSEGLLCSYGVSDKDDSRHSPGTGGWGLAICILWKCLLVWDSGASILSVPESTNREKDLKQEVRKSSNRGSPAVMAKQLQKSCLPPSCTPPPQRGSAHGGVGEAKDTQETSGPGPRGQRWSGPKNSTCWVTTKWERKQGIAAARGRGGLQGI